MVDDTVSDVIAVELLATLHEALSNVVRHTQASSVQVVVACDDDVTLWVLDDGRGVPNNVVSGNGTGNLTARAVLLGGRCQLVSGPDGGSLLERQVPNTH